MLGRGGMAEVRKGNDLRLGRVVAIKRLRTDLGEDPTFQARFRREAQSAASLNHPSIVAIWAIVLTYAVIAAPFVLSGILVALTLTRFPRDVGRLYAFDLVGAALGCVLLVWLLEITDGPTAVLAIAALAAIGGVFYAFDEGSTRLDRVLAVRLGWLAFF